MIIIVLFIEYKDISSDYYSADGKTLRRVTDSSPNLRISSKCEIIEGHCFEKSSSLQYFTFEENPNLTVIGKYSFNKCINLTIINLSSCSKLTKISNGAFSGCSSVVEVIFSEGLLEIQENAFYYAYKLTNIIIPASLEIIGEGAFDSCSKLKTVIFEEGSNLTSLLTL